MEMPLTEGLWLGWQAGKRAGKRPGRIKNTSSGSFLNNTWLIILLSINDYPSRETMF